jgi:hypothetical protein
MKKWLLLAFALFALPAFADISVIQIQNNGVPIRNIGGGIFRLNFASGCSWDSLNGRVTCTFASLVNETDDGTSFCSGTFFCVDLATGNITAGGTLKTGGSTLTNCDSSTAGCWTGPEGTAGNGSSGVDTIWFDSTAHRPKVNPNNAGAAVLGFWKGTAAGDVQYGGTVANGIAPETRLAAGTSTQVLHSGTTPSWSAVVEADQTLADNTTANASTSAHGYLKKLDNTATHYMDGTGAWSTPGGASGIGTVFSASTSSSTVNSATTTFLAITGNSGFGATEGTKSSVVTAACTAKNLYVVTSSTQSANNNLVITVRKGTTTGNMADTIITLTIAAGATAATFTDLVNTVAVSAGDLLDYKLLNNANVASAVVTSIGLQCQ